MHDRIDAGLALLAYRMNGGKGEPSDYLPQWAPPEWIGPVPGEEDDDEGDTEAIIEMFTRMAKRKDSSGDSKHLASADRRRRQAVDRVSDVRSYGD